MEIISLDKEFDDTLNLILGTENPKNEKPPRPYTSQGFKETSTNFFGELENNLDGEVHYNPGFQRDTKKRPGSSMGTVGLSEELKSKKNELFYKDSSNNNSTSDLNEMKQRPATMESKPITTLTDDFTDINITASRRNKGRATTTKETRPYTSPAMIEKDSAISGDDNLTDFGGITPAEYKGDDEDAVHSEYLAHVTKGREKRGATTQPRIKLDTQSEAGGNIKDHTPKKSPVSVQEGFSTKESFFPGGEERKKEYISNRNELLDPNTSNKANEFTPNITSVSRRGNRAETKKMDGVKTDDQLSGITKPFTPAEGNSIIGIKVDSQKNIPVDAALKSYYNESEELYKMRLKETEDYYEQRFKQLKSSLDEEKKKWEEAHQREIDLLKKEKEDLKDSLALNVERERTRLTELHKLELESKEKLHKYEIERQRHLAEEQNESLKRQLEAQIKLNALADEIRLSSTKINALSDKLEHEKIAEEEKKKMDLFTKEKALEDRERKLNHEKELLEAEKRKLEKMKSDFEARELELQKNLEKERELIKNEYNRLTDLQESIRNMENERKRDLELEKKAVESKKAQIEKENLDIKEDLNRKYQELELQNELLETRKQEFEEMMEKSEEALRKKHEEVDNIRKRLTLQEADMLRKLKNIEQKELFISQQADELQTKIDLFQMERLSFEREKIQIQEIAGKTREESEVINKFKREFDSEKEKNNRLKLELDKYAFNLQNEKKRVEEEKSNLNIMHRTLEGIRYNYVKDLSNNLDKPMSATNMNFNPMNVTTKDHFTSNTSLLNHKRSGSVFGEVEEKARETTTGFNSLGRATYSDNKKHETSDKFILLKDAKHSDYRKTDADPMRNTNFKPFNLKAYMDQLKEIDKSTTNNQTFITLEKEGLIQSKLQIHNGHLHKLKTITGSELTSKSSPRFKHAVFSSELDSL